MTMWIRRPLPARSSRYPIGSTLTRMSEIFAALGDARPACACLLALSHQPLCVHELSEVLGVSVSAVSHQLRTLKMLKLVSAQRAGKRVYYSLDDVHTSTTSSQRVCNTLWSDSRWLTTTPGNRAGYKGKPSA
jgi:DNA-binding transcriptional ArsR family regulator